MRKFLSFGLLALLVAAPVQGQFSDGTTGTATFQGNTSTTNAPWFVFDVTIGDSSDPIFSGNVDFVCVDANIYVHRRTQYDVTFHDLALGNNIAGYDIQNLTDAALAYDYIEANSHLQGDLGAQLAIWDLMGTRAGSYYGSTATNAAYDDVMTYVANNRADGLNFDRYAYFLMTGTNSHRGTMQPQLTRIDVPEPGTTVLLASGLLGLFAVGFRRNRAAA